MSVSKNVLWTITMEIPKDFLQMPRPLCNFLHVYFLKIQVCNKTICVKKKQNRRKEEVFTNLLLAFLYNS